MQQKIILEVPTPCHENWNNMATSTQNQPGKFCGNCQKNVVDFTGMTDAQVLDYFSTHPMNTCGRFENDQLNRVLATPPPPQKTWYKWVMAALVSGFILSNKAKAQTGKKVGEVSICQTRPKLIGDTVRLQQMTLGKVFMPQKNTSFLQGSVLDEKGNPVTGASVMLKGSKIGTVTDSHGKFSIVYDKNINRNILTVSYIGYNSTEQNIDLIKVVEMNNINQQPNETQLRPIILSINNAPLLGDVVVGDYVVVKHLKKTNKIVDTLHSLLTNLVTPENNKLNIYPNPAKGGSAVNIVLPKSGDYQLQLVDLQLNVIATQQTNITNDNSKTSFNVPNSIAKGEYILTAIHAKNKTHLIGKLIVQ